MADKVVAIPGRGGRKAVRRKKVRASDSAISKLRGDRERIYLEGPRIPPGLFVRTSMSKPPAFAGLVYTKDPITKKTVKKSEITLGQSTRITCAEAVTMLNQLQAAADLGQNPTHSGKAGIADAKTTNELLDEYVKAGLIRTARDKVAVIRRLLDGHLDEPVAAITTDIVSEALKVLVRAGKRRSHNLALTGIRSWREWILESYTYDIPDWCAGVKNVRVVTAERKILSREELNEIWVKSERMHPAFCALVRTLMLSGLRLNEAARLTRGELNGDIEIPGSRMKNGMPHVVPISSALRKVLDNRLAEATFGSGEFIFSTTDGRTAITGWSNAKNKLDVAGFGYHSLRHAMATNMAENLQTDEDLVERILAHKRVGVMGIYNRSVRLEERRTALERWGEWIVD
jgi:integrase